MNVGHSSMDELSKLELLSALADFQGADFAGPVVNILEQMVMNGLQMREIEHPAWDSFLGALNDETALNAIERHWIDDAKPISEYAVPG